MWYASRFLNFCNRTLVEMRAIIHFLLILRIELFCFRHFPLKYASVKNKWIEESIFGAKLFHDSVNSFLSNISLLRTKQNAVFPMNKGYDITNLIRQHPKSESILATLLRSSLDGIS